MAEITTQINKMAESKMSDSDYVYRPCSSVIVHSWKEDVWNVVQQSEGEVERDGSTEVRCVIMRSGTVFSFSIILRPNQGQGPSNVPHRHQTMQQQQEQFDYHQQPQSLQSQPQAQPQPRQSRSRAQRNDDNPPWIEQAEHYGQPQHSLGGNTQSYDIDSSYQPIALNSNNAPGGYDMTSGSGTPPPPSTNTGAPVDASEFLFVRSFV